MCMLREIDPVLFSGFSTSSQNLGVAFVRYQAFYFPPDLLAACKYCEISGSNEEIPDKMM